MGSEAPKRARMPKRWASAASTEAPPRAPAILGGRRAHSPAGVRPTQSDYSGRLPANLMERDRIVESFERDAAQLDKG